VHACFQLNPLAGNLTLVYAVFLNTDVSTPLGMLGNRESSSDYCQHAPEYPYGDGMPTYYYGFTCERVLSFLCYSGNDDLLNLGLTYGFEYTPVQWLYSPAAYFGNWTTFVSEFYFNSPFPTGCNPDGTTGENCDDFTNTTAFAVAGDDSLSPCSWNNYIFCVCVGSNYTVPTSSPTAAG
jgi:hypothetical protein